MKERIKKFVAGVVEELVLITLQGGCLWLFWSMTDLAEITIFTAVGVMGVVNTVAGEWGRCVERGRYI